MTKRMDFGGTRETDAIWADVRDNLDVNAKRIVAQAILSSLDRGGWTPCHEATEILVAAGWDPVPLTSTPR